MICEIGAPLEQQCHNVGRSHAQPFFSSSEFVFMPSPIDRCVGGIMFSGCSSVSACFRACVCQGVSTVSTISQTIAMDGISPNFGWSCSWWYRWTD